MNREASPSHKLRLRKRIAFSAAATALFFAALEGLLAVGGLRPRIVEEDPYVGFESRVPLFVSRSQPDGTTLMVRAENKARFFNEQAFTDPKPEGTFRIFCLGGSTTYGRPYNDTTSFSGWLRRFLDTTDPEERCEVVNAGGISYASYRAAALMEELERYEPDLFIVYTGHNEFLEERTYAGLREQPAALRRVVTALHHTRTFSALSGLAKAVRNGAGTKKGYTLTGEVDTLLDKSVGPSAYRRDDALRADVIAHVRLNLQRMKQIAGRCGASIIFVTPASSLKDCSPFKSEFQAGLSPGHMDMIEELMAGGRAAMRSGEYTEADALMEKAIALDDRYAGSHYLRGQALFAMHNHEGAKEHFLKARDEDIVPLRALTGIVEAVRRFAREEGASLVDFETIVGDVMLAEHGHAIPGRELFLDHVHPTPRGHRILAEHLFQRMVQQRLVKPSRPLGPLVETIEEDVMGALDLATRGTAWRNLAKVMSWAGKIEDAERMADKALQALGEDAESLFILGMAAAERESWEDAEDFYRRALAQEPDYIKALHNLGIVLSRTGRHAEAIEQYRRVVALSPDHPNVHFNLAKAYDRSGDDAAALDAFLTVLANDADDADAHYYAGILYLDREDPREAARHFKETLRLSPGDAEAQAYLTRIHAAQAKALN